MLTAAGGGGERVVPVGGLTGLAREPLMICAVKIVTAASTSPVAMMFLRFTRSSLFAY
jgi:hypothetical protein